MPRTRDISPIADVEQIVIGWDFTRLIPAGVEITSVATTCLVDRGVDPDAMTCLIGQPGFLGSLVSQMFAPRVAGTRYLLTATVSTSDGEEEAVWYCCECIQVQ